MVSYVKATCLLLYCLLATKLTYSQNDYELDYSEDELSDSIANDAQGINDLFGTFPFEIEPPTMNVYPGLSTTARSLQNFSFDIFNAIQHEVPQGQNMAISPLSIFTALAMLRPGLAGESLTQLNNALGNEPMTNVEIGNTMEEIFSDVSRYDLDYANRVYVDQSILLRKTYKRELENLKVVLAKRVNFTGQPEITRERINRYVRKKTNRLIEEMVPQSGITPMTKLYLINALYLRAKWNSKFSTRSTTTKAFHTDQQNSVMVPTMHTDFATCTHYTDDVRRADVTVLSLQDDLSMIMVMPQQTGNFSDLFDDEQTSMRNKFQGIINNIWTAEDDGERYLQACSIDMPKFSIQYQSDLINSLRTLGLTDIFDASSADLSHMTQREVNDLYVSDANHKAVITANEEGIEAGAATSIGVSVRRAAEIRVHINKPFLFAIRQDNTGAILFVGKVVRP